MTELVNDTILVPHGTVPSEVRSRALARAEAKLAPGESLVSFELGPGFGTGPTSPMAKFGFSYRILRPA